mmetsp:Transcript_64634/g.172426  ORF Transcript_64634/g.172426 Transcript_64634/m.172426 type:complete len:219 (-) Transcript_64634:7-663(-)
MRHAPAHSADLGAWEHPLLVAVERVPEARQHGRIDQVDEGIAEAGPGFEVHGQVCEVVLACKALRVEHPQEHGPSVVQGQVLEHDRGALVGLARRGAGGRRNRVGAPERRRHDGGRHGGGAERHRLRPERSHRVHRVEAGEERRHDPWLHGYGHVHARHHRRVARHARHLPWLHKVPWLLPAHRNLARLGCFGGLLLLSLVGLVADVVEDERRGRAGL